jgi:hypothetical protein
VYRMIFFLFSEREILTNIIVVEMKRYQLHLELCMIAQERRSDRECVVH